MLEMRPTWPLGCKLPTEYNKIEFFDGIQLNIQEAQDRWSCDDVRDMAKINQRGLPPMGQYGWCGIQDGGASSVVIGHTTLH